MNKLEEALKLFKLNLPLTIGEEKKAYKKLAKKYHPDFNGSDEYYEREMKEINKCHDFLCKYLNGNVDKYGYPLNKSVNKSKESSNLYFYQKQLINNFKMYVIMSILSYNNKTSLINNFCNEILSKNDKQSLDLCYESYKKIFYNKIIATINKKTNFIFQISESDYSLKYQAFNDLIKKKVYDFYSNKFKNILSKYQTYQDNDIIKQKIIELVFECKKEFEYKFSAENINAIEFYNLLISNLEKKINCAFQLDLLLKKANNTESRKMISDYIIKFNYTLDFDDVEKFILNIKNNWLLSASESSFDELKTSILQECTIIHQNDVDLVCKGDKIVGIYYPETDTLNVLIFANKNVVWNHRNLAWIVLSSKFNVMDNCKYQEADAAWIIGSCGAFYSYNLSANNMFLESNFTRLFDEKYVAPLGTCNIDFENKGFLNIELLEYNIRFEYRRSHYKPFFNSNLAVLNRRGEIKEDDGLLHDYLKEKCYWYYNSGFNTTGSKDVRDYIDYKSRITNHYQLCRMVIFKQKLEKHKVIQQLDQFKQK